jgi:hypothetical protein
VPPWKIWLLVHMTCISVTCITRLRRPIRVTDKRHYKYCNYPNIFNKITQFWLVYSWIAAVLDNPCSKSTYTYSQFPYQTFTERVLVYFTFSSPASWTNNYFTFVFWWENWYCIFQALIALVLTVTIPNGNSIGVRESAGRLKCKFNLTNRNLPVTSFL